MSVNCSLHILDDTSLCFLYLLLHFHIWKQNNTFKTKYFQVTYAPTQGIPSKVCLSLR